MATKLICDGCGHEIPKYNPAKPTIGDGLVRSAALHLGNNTVQWDLCDPCLERAASALAEALPHSPRSEWNHVVRPTPKA
jgi:hypothetical protein